jgi:hypothetical protein
LGGHISNNKQLATVNYSIQTMKRLLTTETIPQAQIDAWKQLHKDVFAITVPATDEDEGKEDGEVLTGYFRKPKLDELGMAAQASRDNALMASQVIYNTCLLGGHPAFNDDEDVVRAALAKFGNVIKTREAQIKKL